MRMRTFWTTTALVAAMALSASAQNPELAGIWHLNLAKSFLGGEHPSSDYQFTSIFVEKEGAIDETDVARNQSMYGISLPDSKTSLSFVTDGKEHEVRVPAQFPGLPPTPMMITAEWQGNTLFVMERGSGFRGPSTTYRRYYLSSDGLELIELVKKHSLSGDSDQRLAFDRSSKPGK